MDISPAPYTYLQNTEADPTSLVEDVMREMPDFGSDTQGRSKAEYIEYLICGASPYEAAEMANLKWGTVRRWQTDDTAFKTFCQERVPLLRRTLSSDLIRAQFTRNMALAFRIDYSILIKAKVAPEEMTDQDHAYLRSIRRMYGPGELMQLIRATSPDPSDALPTGTTNITIVLDGSQVNDEVHQQAAAKKLLGLFRRSQVIEGEIIDGRG